MNRRTKKSALALSHHNHEKWALPNSKAPRRESLQAGNVTTIILHNGQVHFTDTLSRTLLKAFKCLGAVR